MKHLRLVCAALLLAVPALAAAEGPAGSVTLITGRGTASSAESGIRSLAKGDSVYSGDMVHSSANSFINLKFSDGGYFLLRPNTRFQVVDFVDHSASAPLPPAELPNPNAAVPQQPLPPPPPAPARSTSSHAFFSLLKGGFRSVSGLIGKINHDEYQVSTPVATIGIRGTDYLAVICDATCATDPEIAPALPPGANPLGGIVATVYSHSIVVTDAGGEVTLQEGQYLLVLPDGTNIRLPGEPHFLHVDPTPNPANCGVE